jgi:hypothetical protein
MDRRGSGAGASFTTGFAMYADVDVIVVWRRAAGDVEAWLLEDRGRGGPLPAVLRHSVGCPYYGRRGAGAKDLALSILTAAVGADLADRWYQRFSKERVAGRVSPAWTTTIGAVREWVQDREGALSHGQAQT